MHWEQHQGITLNALWAALGKVDAYIARGDLHTYVVLGERWDNPAASVTNAYERYARQICERFSIDSRRAVFFELYVIPKLQAKQIQLEYELDVCTPHIDALDNAEIQWRPSQVCMKNEIIATLSEQCQLTHSYAIPDKVQRHLESG